MTKSAKSVNSVKSVGYCVTKDQHGRTTGYTVTPYYDDGSVGNEYSAGNHRLDSQGYVNQGDSNALTARELRKFAKQTAGEMAVELGLKKTDIFEDKDTD